MPYRRKYSKKRSFKKRRKFNRRRKRFLPRYRTSKLRLYTPSVMPDTMYLKMKYVETHFFTAGIGSSQNYALNDVRDPDITGLGHQPLGFDQWMAFYQFFEVLGSQIKLKGLNESNTVSWQIACYPAIQTPSLTISAAKEQPYVSYRFQAGAATGNQIMRMRKYMSVRKLEGRSTASINFTGTASSSPSSLRFWVIQIASVNQASTINVQLDVELTYYVKLFRRINLSQS